MATWTINGNTYSDNSTPGTRNLDNDGHRENFPLLCADIATVAGQVQTNATQVAADRATVTSDKATVAADKAIVAADKATVAADKAIVAADKAIVAADKAIVAADKGTVATDKGIVTADKATVAADKATTQGYRDSAQSDASTATTKAAEAAASAVTALNAPGTAGTSTTSSTIGTGSKTITTQTAKAWVLGQPLKISRTADPSGTWMAGDITAYNSGTGSLTVDVKSTAGSGTFTDWTISLTAPVGGSVSIASVSGLQDALDAKLDDSQATGTGLSVLGAANGAAVLSIAGGQAADATLTALAGVTVAANKMLYATDADAFATTDLTSFARTLLDDANAAAARETLELSSTHAPTFAGASLNGAVTINDNGADVDFRVEGDTKTHLLFLDASTDRIGINQSSPAARLDVDGTAVSNIVAMAADAMDLSLGEYFTKTINGAWSPTFSNIPASRAVSWRLRLTHTSGTITWPAAVKWNKNTIPTFTPGSVHIVFFSTDDGGTTVRAGALTDYTS